jgi:hypothetical protein
MEQTIEVRTQIIRQVVAVTARREEVDTDSPRLVLNIIARDNGEDVMHTYYVGEAGQQEITKAITGGLHIPQFDPTKLPPNA